MSTFSELLCSAEQMVSALSVNQGQVFHRRIEEFITTGQELVDNVKALSLEQEQIKSALKLKTEQLEAAQKKLKDWQAEAASSVKLSFRSEKDKWSEFGIKATK